MGGAWRSVGGATGRPGLGLVTWIKGDSFNHQHLAERLLCDFGSQVIETLATPALGYGSHCEAQAPQGDRTGMPSAGAPVAP